MLQFSNDVIKVGSSSDAVRRIDQHRRDAARYGLSIANSWSSDPEECFEAQERDLLSVLAHLGRRTSGGREYFLGVPFEMARFQAQHARQLKTKVGCCETGVAPLDMIIPAKLVSVESIEEPTFQDRGYICDIQGELVLECGSRVRAIMCSDRMLKVGHEFDVEFDWTSASDEIWTAYLSSDPR
ncbi:GIY-YIG nuclease family protein [Amycolatopsis thailandensis]|uniref:GIY-YIG nuclease family protein n=1 Tax=Amycolatopsis thailandensis TaxID=589330 RepID=UPI003CC64D24